MVKIRNQLTIDGQITPERELMVVQWGSQVITICDTIRTRSLAIPRCKNILNASAILNSLNKTMEKGVLDIREIEMKIENEISKVNEIKWEKSFKQAIEFKDECKAKSDLIVKSIEQYMESLKTASIEKKAQSLSLQLCMLSYLMRHTELISKHIDYMKEIGATDGHVMSLYMCMKDAYQDKYCIPTIGEIRDQFASNYKNAIKAIFVDHTKVFV